MRYLRAVLVFAVLIAAHALIDARAANDAAYHGNTKTYKFHRSTCRFYSCPHCTAKFKTREEAIAAGYRPCGTCDP